MVGFYVSHCSPCRNPVASLPVTALGGMWRLGAPGEWVLDLALAAAGRMHARSLGAAASWLHPVGSSISASAPCPAGYPSLQLIQLLSLTVHPYCAAAAVFVTAGRRGWNPRRQSN
jgi:hypothetical protein